MDFAHVFFEVPMDQGFDYRIPAFLKTKVTEGTRVLAPFGRRNAYGYVWKLKSVPDVEQVKEILSVPDESPVFGPELLELAKAISDYYLCPLGLVLKTMLPAPIRKIRPDQKKNELAEDGRDPDLELPRRLNEEQQKAWDFIQARIEADNFSVSLIHGVTGSGKTELYLFAIASVLKKNKSAIVLVPEISLTPQTTRRVRQRFGKVTAVLHSRMSAKERVLAWEKIRKGEARVVVGPRSAIFAPVRNLGLIIVDEEHERSYKQEEIPRYHARDAAILRAQIEKIPVFLGTATPSLESYFNALNERYHLISLTRRVEDRPLPTVHVVDMRKEAEIHGRLFSFSRTLRNAVQKKLEAREQSILFLNRRGYAPLVICPSCGHVLVCLECDQAMTYHRTKEKLVCHLCDCETIVPKACPHCQKPSLHQLGVGTQRIENNLQTLFSSARVDRVDTDSTRALNAHEKIFEKFQDHGTDILIGTQMVAKGLDFPNVTLVGVLSADVAMSLPDFRMGEHTFQLLTQVAGRAGRGEKKGDVYIQTFTPFHPIIRAAVSQNYEEFYQKEIEYRRQLGYPPFSRLMNILIEGKDLSQVSRAAHGLEKNLKKVLLSPVRIIGPHPAPTAKIKGKHRWQIIVFCPRGKRIHAELKSILGRSKNEKAVKIVVDVDPVSLL